MVGATLPPDPLDEGYPRSAAADLDPGPDLRESLEEADRAASEEHRVMPEHYRAAGPPDRGDGFEDIDNMGYR
jgi:hypothetical protein